MSQGGRNRVVPLVTVLSCLVTSCVGDGDEGRTAAGTIAVDEGITDGGDDAEPTDVESAGVTGGGEDREGADTIEGEQESTTATTTTTDVTTTTALSATTTASAPTTKDWANLREGECVTGLPATGTVSSVQVVPCTAEHQAEVIHWGQLGVADVTLHGVDSTASAACDAALVDYVGAGADVDSLAVSFLVAAPPTSLPGQTTVLGLPALNRYTVVCLAADVAGSALTGSIGG